MKFLMLFEFLGVEEQTSTLRTFTGFGQLRLAKALGLRFAFEGLVLIWL
jgi:hypothetical protein